MKKIFTLSLLLATAGMALAAAPESAGLLKVAAAPVKKAISATNSEIINSQPEGTLIDPLYCSSDISYLIYGGALGGMRNNNGYAGAMVRTEDAVYIRNIVSQYNTSAEYWVKGDVEADGSVTFKFPQHINHTSTSVERDFYVAVLTPGLSGSSVVLSVDEANCDLHMKWEGNRLVQQMPEPGEGSIEGYEGIIGVVDGEGSFMGFGEQSVAYKLADTTLAEPAADLTVTPYVINYKNGNGEELSGLINVAVDGDNVWFKGFNTFIPEAWVKGVMADNVITVPSTFTGVTQGYFTYVTGLTADRSQLIDHVTINKTENGYAVDGTLFISLGDETVDYNTNRAFTDIVLTPYVAGVKTPVAPEIDTSDEGTEAWTEAEGMGALIFTLEAKDTDGQPLDPEKLFYMVYRNGEPYTFTTADYGVEEDMVEIPYNYQGDLIMSMSGYFFVFFIHDMDTIGVQSIYRDGENVTTSPVVTHVFHSSVKEVTTDSPVVAEEYYSLDGVKLTAPAGRVCVKVTRHADGTITATKLLRK